MMFDWQTILVFLTISIAAFFVARRAWRKLRGFSDSSCATGCGKCGSEIASGSPKTLQIKRR
jgi:hypothetical protein